MSFSAPSVLQEAVALADAALALCGHDLNPITRALIAEVSRGEVAAEQAIEHVLAHYGELGPR